MTGRTLLALSLGTNLAAVFGFFVSARLEITSLLKGSIVLLLLGACGVAGEIIWKREETVFRNDDVSVTYGILHGFQAVASGLSYLLLALSLLVPALAWAAGWGEWLTSWLETHAGLPVLIGGLWLFLNFVGVVFGTALSSLGVERDGFLDSALIFVNGVLEKAISLVLCLVGMALTLWGALSLLERKGPIAMLLEWL